MSTSSSSHNNATTRSLTGASDTAVIIDAIKGLHGHSIVTVTGDTPQAALVPKGMNLENLKPLTDSWRTHPERIRQTMAAGTVDALIDYVNRFRGDSTLGFFDANDIRGMVVALDYHDAAAQDAPKASHVTHLCSYRFPLSDELQAWLTFAAAPQTSQDFAEFLLDRAHDVESPPVDWMMVERETLDNVCDALNLHDDRVPSSIGKDARGEYIGVEEIAAEFAATDDEDGIDPDGPLIPRTALWKLRKMRFASAHTITSLARSVQINSTSKARSVYDPKSGNTSILFEENNQATSRSGEKVKLPDGFFLFIPVFRGEPPRLIACRLKHRVQGTVYWMVEIADAARLIDRAITTAAARVQEKTGVPMLRGLPIGQAVISALIAEANQVRAIVKPA